MRKNNKTILNMIHFDSDVIFCDSAIELLIKEGKKYDLIGQCRPYKNNVNNVIRAEKYCK